MPARIRPDVAIDFDVHYFVQKLDGEPKVFGWVSGDEQALLRKHGILVPPSTIGAYSAWRVHQVVDTCGPATRSKL